jgi:NitT/TauT family transport system ATP-binding protein
MSAALNIGFLPLTDAAALIAAVDFGFAQDNGLTINLHRDVSWANLRDRLMVGHYDAAHMLAPLALAASMGVGQAKCPLRAPFLLNLNGNGITLSKRLLEDFAAMGCDPLADWMTAARGLAALVRTRQASGSARLTLATVHLLSAHTYQLRLFLRAGGLDPDRDVELVVAPPPFMVDFMDRGLIDGFCVGSPWNSLAVDRGRGVLVALGCEVLADAPEKVLAMPAQGRLTRGDEGVALLRALTAASAFVDDPANRAALTQAMARPDRLDCPAEVIARTLSGRLLLDAAGRLRERADFIRFSGSGLHRPDGCAAWIVEQMMEAGQITDRAAALEAAAQVFNPDLALAAEL